MIAAITPVPESGRQCAHNGAGCEQEDRSNKMEAGDIVKIWIARVICAGLVLALSLDAAYADDSAGTVKSVRGDVSIVRAGALIKAFAGLKLMAADQIVTGADGSVGVTLQDATLLSFGPKSSSQLKEFRYDPVKRDGNLLISLLKGSMRFVTGQLGKLNPASVAIMLPTATLGVRGTDFIVSVEGGS